MTVLLPPTSDLAVFEDAPSVGAEQEIYKEIAMIGVVVTLEVQDGKQADFEGVFKDLMAKVKANESGCTTYQLYKSKNSETTYTVMEEYASDDALASHGKTDYFLAAQPALGACLAGAPVIEVLDIVE